MLTTLSILSSDQGPVYREPRMPDEDAAVGDTGLLAQPARQADNFPKLADLVSGAARLARFVIAQIVKRPVSSPS